MLTLVSAIAGITVLLVCAQMLSAGRATASSDEEAYLNKIAKAYNASAVKLVEDKWHNRTDVEMIVNGNGYKCLMPTLEEVKKAEPLECTTFVFLATHV